MHETAILVQYNLMDSIGEETEYRFKNIIYQHHNVEKFLC